MDWRHSNPWNQQLEHWLGACPTNDISIELEIQRRFAMFLFTTYSANHNKILHCLTVVTCAKFLCDRFCIFQTRALQILIEFWLFNGNLWHWRQDICRHSDDKVWSSIYQGLNTLRPRRNGQHVADAISNVFSSKKVFEFRLKFPWSLFLRVQLTIFQHWFR